MQIKRNNGWRVKQFSSLILITSMLLSGCWGSSADDGAPASSEDQQIQTEVANVAPAANANAASAGTNAAQPVALGSAQFGEAPMLRELVASGALPVVNERLPAEPLVVDVVDSIGKYGGTWRRVFKGNKDFHAFGRIVYEPMLRWPRNPSDPIQPGLAKAWEWSEDGKVLTLHLRQGLKWSDGAPFTTADITFWWEDIELDKNITPAPHAEWVVAGQPMQLEPIDDYTIKLKFVASNGLAETVGLAFHGNQWPLGFERFGFFAPRHYLEQYHPKYNASVTDYQLFEEMAFDFNTERPSMTPWRVTKFDTGGTEMIATRNPFYWKVDGAGNQLPYIDQVQFALVGDNEAANLLALEGSIDMQSRHMDFAKIQIFQEVAKERGFHVGLWSSANASAITFFPNQSYPDQKYRELIQNLEFRRALSLAIDRELINFISFLGQAVDSTQSVVRNSALYQPDIASTYIDYNHDAAREILDQMGLPVDDEGFRVFPDGSPLTLVVETHFTSGSSLDGVEVTVENWNEIGIRTVLQTMSRDIYWPRATSNEVMIGVWGTDRGLVPMVDPIYQFPFDERSWMGPAFGIWYKSQGQLGEEPPIYFRQMMDMYDLYRLSPDPAQQLMLAKELVRRSSENLYTIGTVGEQPSIVIVKDDFKNVIETGFTADWIIMAPGTQDPSQYYFDR